MPHKSQRIQSEPRFGVGTQFIPNGKDYTVTVVDVLKTHNLAGELVGVEYIGEHTFLGPQSAKYIDTTVAIGVHNLETRKS